MEGRDGVPIRQKQTLRREEKTVKAAEREGKATAEMAPMQSSAVPSACSAELRIDASWKRASLAKRG